MRTPIPGLIVLWHCTWSLPAAAQEPDSLRAIAHDETKPDTVRLQALRDVIWTHYMLTDPDSAYVLSDSLFRYASAVGYMRHQGNGLSMKATIHFNRGEHDKARELYFKCMEFFEQCGSLTGQASTWLNLANIHNQKGEHRQAIEAYTKAGELYEQKGSLEGRAQVLSNIGALYYHQMDYQKASGHFERSIALYEQLGIWHNVALVLSNLGNVHSGLKDHDRAILLYKRAVGICDSLGADALLVDPAVNLGMTLLDLGRAEEAEPYLQRGLAVADILGDGLKGCIARIGMAEIALADGDAHRARTLGEKALALAEANEAIDELRLATGLLHKVYKVLGEDRRALVMHERHILYRDSLTNEENARALLRSEYEKENEKRALADSLMHASEKENASLAHAAQLAQERNRRNVLLAGSMVLLVIAIAVWTRMRQVARTNRAIQAAQLQVVESERKREAEQVRTRIATDIHDDLGSGLTKLGLLGREVAQADADTLKDLAARIVDLSSTTADALGHIVWTTDPEQDTIGGTLQRAEHTAQAILEKSGIAHEVRVTHTGADGALDAQHRHHLLMILKEALNNTMKHARAKNVRVMLSSNERGYELIVEDDGIGYAPEQMDRGMGARSMRSRTGLLGGKLNVESSPGAGCRTTLRCEWPNTTNAMRQHPTLSDHVRSS